MFLILERVIHQSRGDFQRTLSIYMPQLLCARIGTYQWLSGQPKENACKTACFNSSHFKYEALQEQLLFFTPSENLAFISQAPVLSLSSKSDIRQQRILEFNSICFLAFLLLHIQTQSGSRNLISLGSMQWYQITRIIRLRRLDSKYNSRQGN